MSRRAAAASNIGRTTSRRDRRDGSRERVLSVGGRRLVTIARRVLLAVLVAALLRATVIDTVVVAAPGMAPVLAPGDHALALKPTFGLGLLDRGDVVLVTPPADWLPPSPSTGATRRTASFLLGRSTGAMTVLRVIGMPGDTVQGRADGTIFVNDVPLDESSYVRRAVGATSKPFDVVVPLGRLWLMADDRSVGGDSATNVDRAWNGSVPVDNVHGRVRFVYWPLSHLRSIATPEGISAR